MIESVVWTNLGNGSVMTFNDNTVPFNSFTTEVDWRQESSVRPQDHGEFPGLPYLGTRRFRAEGDIMQTSAGGYITTRLNMMRALMPTPHLGNKAVGTLQITFTGLPMLRALCSLDGYPELPMEGLGPSHGAYMITWKSYDPRLYSDTQFSAISSSPGATAGRTFPKTFPWTYNVSTGAGGDTIATNAGIFDTPPTVEITGPATGPQISLIRGTETLTVGFESLTIDSGDTLSIDFANRTAVLTSGQDVYFAISQRDWFTLDPGNNTLRYSAYIATSPSKATVRWRDAYMI